MTKMFYRCYSLKNIIISNFNVDNAIELNSMLLCCKDELKMKIRTEHNIIRDEAFE